MHDVIFVNRDFLAAGLLATLQISAISIVCGTLIGAVVALLRYLRVPFAARFCALYVGLIQGAPLLVVLLFCYFALPALFSYKTTAYWATVLGGLAASLVVDRVYTLIVGANHGQLRQYLAWASSYAVLGCFLAVAPGVVAKNAKRLVIGLAGGIIGGAVGGLLLDPISQATGNVELGRLAAMASIGLITGAATGIIERNSSSTAIPRTSAPRQTARFISSRTRKSAAATRPFICKKAASKSRTFPSAPPPS